VAKAERGAHGDDQRQNAAARTPAAQGLYDPAFERDSCGVGFVVDVAGRKSHAIIDKALTVLKNLLHRGACGCEVNTGDGAGVLVQMPTSSCTGSAPGGDPPAAPRHYGAGSGVPAPGPVEAARCQAIFEGSSGRRAAAARLAQRATADHMVGPSARAAEPAFLQIFIGRDPALADISLRAPPLRDRKRVEHAIYGSDLPSRRAFYVVSLSANTLIYKGMLSADQIESMFPRHPDPDLESALAWFTHVSDDTFPPGLGASLPLHRPQRRDHALRATSNWMRAREGLLQSELIPDLHKIVPIISRRGERLGHLRQ